MYTYFEKLKIPTGGKPNGYSNQILTMYCMRMSIVNCNKVKTSILAAKFKAVTAKVIKV